MEIPFTQYKLPHGRTESVSIERYGQVARKAEQIIAKGLHFECEILPTGEVSLTITDEKEGDLAIELCPNGPEVNQAIDKLIAEFPLDRTSLPWGEPSG